MIPFLISWPGGSLESTIRLVALVIIAYALVLWLSAIVWTYRDVRNRTTDPMSQVVAVMLVALFNLPGLIVYLVIRPQATLADAYERSLEAEAILHELQLTANACQTCQRPIEDDFNICPYCRTTLREACRSCGHPIRTSWLTCPYCATDRVSPRPAPATDIVPQRPASTAGRVTSRAPAAGQATAVPLTRPRRASLQSATERPAPPEAGASRP